PSRMLRSSGISPSARIALASLVVIGATLAWPGEAAAMLRGIGLRMAVGARARDILRQFLVEAITLSMLGGLVGIALGVATSFAVGEFANWRTDITPQAVALAVGFSAAVGVFFGFYPARKASRLLPIEALRYE
ncbi:MAG: ABC transporter permease, partial [bacterium]